MLIEQNILLSHFTTFKIGGTADYFCAVKNEEELKEAVFFAKQKKLPIFILGSGSNLLVSDSGFRGLVIKIEICGIEQKEFENGKVEITAGAGENWDNFVKMSVDKGFFGLENLSGIPGTVGGAIIQNAGAYGAETGNLISYVEVLDIEKMETKKLSKDNCRFGYRNSFFKTAEGKKLIILKAVFILESSGELDTEYKDIKKYIEELKIEMKTLTPAQVRKIILEIRSGKLPDPSKMATAGSFFKNPVVSKEKYQELLKNFPEMPSYKIDDNFVKIPLAWVLEKVCGLKGFKQGNVGLYEKQPIVVVNFGKATSKDVESLAVTVAKIVKEKTGIEIENEVERVE
ncbi:MAG: UDP-N-acetylmuramate dehydrogenase [Candidatus Paceibacterota bacterium]